jgi:hypothetical protein
MSVGWLPPHTRKTSEKLMVEKEQRDSSRAKGLSEEIIYKVDIPANR